MRPRTELIGSARHAIRPRPVSNLPAAVHDERSAGAMHPGAVGAALVVAVWFVIVMAISFSLTAETAYLMAVVVAFSIIFFTLTLGIASRGARAGNPDAKPTFRQFLAGEVGIHTGEVSGREALVQLLTLPITLALGAMAIGMIFDMGL
jgi:hypothetical protein